MDDRERKWTLLLRSLARGFVPLLLMAGVLFAGCTAPWDSRGGTEPLSSDGSGLGGPLQVAIRAEPARYSPAMSSTVGIRLTLVNTSGVLPPDARFHWETDFGYFLQWNPPDFRMVELGPQCTTGEGSVYWSFFSEQGEKERPPVHISLQVVRPSTGVTLALTNLTVSWEDSMTAVVSGGGEASGRGSASSLTQTG